MEEHHALFIMLYKFLALLRLAEIGTCKSVFVRKFFIISLDQSCVSSTQCHNFGPLAADVDANLKVLRCCVFS